MRILITTYPNKPRQLKKFIMAILKQWLAKCVNRINYVKSYYIWQGKIIKDEEKILIIKTSVEKKEKLQTWIEKNHPYQVPEIVWIKSNEVNEKYLKWINN